MDAFSKIRDIVRAEEMTRAHEKRPRETQRLSFDLSEPMAIHSPYEVVHPFKSLLVESVSDSQATVYFMPNSADIGSNAFKLQMRDSWTTEQLVGSGFFYWPAQPGKTMEIVLFFSSEFKSGSYTQITSGGVVLGTGDSVATSNVLIQGTPVSILSQSSTRKNAVVRITRGGPLMFGNSSQQNFGPFFAGDSFEVKNSGSLWCANPNYTGASNTARVSIMEEF